ncbi:MAG: hypothetical protein R3C42_07675 [Parvularculaceae bacterium]
MSNSSLLLQDTPDTGAAGSTLVEAAQPLITGDVTFLWSGVIAFAVIFIIAFWVVARWRARGAGAPRSSYEDTEFFQPAGESAEISFDDASAPAPVADENAFSDAAIGEDEGADVSFEPMEETAAPARKRSPFASLFSKRDKREPTAGVDEEFFAGAEYSEATEDEPFADQSAQTGFAQTEFDESARDVELHRQDEEESDRRWRAAEDERKRRLADEERRRAESEARARNEEIERAHYAAHPELSRAGPQEDLRAPCRKSKKRCTFSAKPFRPKRAAFSIPSRAVSPSASFARTRSSGARFSACTTLAAIRAANLNYLRR